MGEEEYVFDDDEPICEKHQVPFTYVARPREEMKPDKNGFVVAGMSYCALCWPTFPHLVLPGEEK